MSHGGRSEFLGIRYALTCWLDEMLIEAGWREWDENKLESALYRTNIRYGNFWQQARLAHQAALAVGAGVLAVDERQPAADRVGVAETTVVGPELAQRPDPILPARDAALGGRRQVRDAVGAEEDRSDIRCRERRMDLQGGTGGRRA